MESCDEDNPITPTHDTITSLITKIMCNSSLSYTTYHPNSPVINTTNPVSTSSLSILSIYSIKIHSSYY